MKGDTILIIVSSVGMLLVIAGLLLGVLVVKEDCDLILEQRVACFRGCQFNPNFNPNNYIICTDSCMLKYQLEHNPQGDITACLYGGVRYEL